MNNEFIEKFLNEITEQNINYKCSRTILYKEYYKYYYNDSNNSDLTSISKKDFIKYIESKFGKPEKTYYKGLQIKDDKQFIENFLKDCIIEDITYKCSKYKLYVVYLMYCKSNYNIYPYQKLKFNNIIESKFGLPFKSNGIYYRGFKIKEAPNLPINI